MDKISLKETWLLAKHVLDKGCGPFGMALAHEAIKKPLTAVDPLIIEYERALTHFDRSDYPGTTFIETTLENYESDQIFDFVFCLNAINHVENIDLSFDKISKLCETGATLVLGVDAHNFSFFKHLFRWIPGDILHPHQYNLREYELMLEDSGFKIQSRYLIKKEFIFTYRVLVARRC
jgi:2-polyprenyl-3-methyl-5-hydroxy-6-metoxy-1,4-benzoquinol methylase